MGLKENIQVVKEEMSTEEQFLEGIIKGERFFKRNKKYILSAVVLAFLGIGAYGVNDMIVSQQLKASNEAYALLLKDANNTAAKEVLQQKNPKLYTLFLFEQALLQGDKVTLAQVASSKEDAILQDIALYQLSQLDTNATEKGALMGGMILLQEGYALLKEGKVDEARLKFAQIDVNSPLKQIAKNLEHYQGLK